MVEAAAGIDFGGQAAARQQLGNAASERLSGRGGVLNVEQGLREAAKIMDGLVVRGRVHGRPQPLPMGGYDKDRLRRLGQELGQPNEKIARGCRLHSEHGRAVRNENCWQHVSQRGYCCTCTQVVCPR
jgi:hypothetical protein